MKPKLKSVTLWVNAVGAFALHVLSALQEVSPETAWIATAIAVANFALRFKTSEPII